METAILLIFSFTQCAEGLEKSVSAEIKNTDQNRCEQVPVFAYPAENINCEGFVGYGEKCIHKCGETYIESTCEREMLDLGKHRQPRDPGARFPDGPTPDSVDSGIKD